MTADLVSLTDLEAMLIPSPVCENPAADVRGCDREATRRVVWSCHCSAALSCAECAAGLVAWVRQCFREGVHRFECEDCGLRQRADSVSDLLRVELL